MKKEHWMGAMVVLCLMAIGTATWATEGRATKEECVVKVNEVVNRIKAEGFEAVAPAIKPGGPHSWKADGYVFLMSKEGIMLAHPYLPPQMMNRPLLAWKDSNGKAFIKEMVELAQKEGKGWVSYMSRYAGIRDPQLKETYLVGVPEANVIVGAGCFPHMK